MLCVFTSTALEMDGIISRVILQLGGRGVRGLPLETAWGLLGEEVRLCFTPLLPGADQTTWKFFIMQGHSNKVNLLIRARSEQVILEVSHSRKV
jgi:hypothetical protein